MQSVALPTALRLWNTWSPDVVSVKSTGSDSHSQCPSRVSRCPQRSSSARGWPWLGECRSAGWRPGRHEILMSHKQGRLLYEVMVCDFAALLEVVSFSSPLPLVRSRNGWIGSLLFLGSSRRRFCLGRPSWWSWSGGWCLGVWPPRQSTPASVGALFLRRTTEHRDRRDRRDLDLSTRECFLEKTSTCASGQNIKLTLSLG